MLGAAVVPECEAVAPPAESHLIFRNLRLADQIVHQVVGLNCKVLTVTYVLRSMIIDEVARETTDKENFLAGFWVYPNHGMLCGRILGRKFRSLLRRHGRTEGMFDVVLGA